MFNQQGLRVETGDPSRAVAAWCRTCPWVMSRTTEDTAANHARNNPGHLVQLLVTTTFVSELRTAPGHVWATGPGD